MFEHLPPTNKDPSILKLPVSFIRADLMAGLFLVFSSLEAAGDTIKIGILHSLSGTMEISEKALNTDPESSPLELLSAWQ